MPHTITPREWSIEEATPPTIEPVSLDELKSHARILGDDENATLSAILTAARQALEIFTRRTFVETTYKIRLDGFPRSREIYLERPPLMAVDSITYTDEDGAPQTLAAADYQVDANVEPGRVVLAPDASWPATEAQRIASVVIEYRAGYGATASTVPEAIRQGILLLAGAWEANREEITPVRLGVIPYGVERIVWAYRWGDYR